jgi:hypothetical protein
MKTGMGIKAADIEVRYAWIILFLGIFWAFMEEFKKGNSRDKDLVQFFISQFYAKRPGAEATKTNKSYFFNFNHPREPEHEVGSLLFGLVLKLVMEMKKTGHPDATGQMYIPKCCAKPKRVHRICNY